jgi:thiamine biosynthesis protein ThiS
MSDNSSITDPRFEIQLNGEPYTVDGDASLIALVDRLSLKRGRIAVELNREIVPKAEWSTIVLRPGDTLEIVNFVGGG